MHEWMLDNGFTPHVVVDAKRPGVRVPEAHVKDGKIVLNISPAATRALNLGNDVVTFEARFGGVSRPIAIPIGAVLGIYARETGQSIIFDEDDAPVPPPDGNTPAPRSPDGNTPSPPGPGRRAKLKVIK